MNERRGFGRLEVIFILIAATYIGFIIYSGSKDTDGERVVAEATAVVAHTATPDLPILPTERPGDVFTSSDLNRLDVLAARGESISINERLERAGLQQEVGDIAAALTDYNRVLAEAPANSEAILGRASVFVALEAFDMALADYTTLIEGEPNAGAARMGRAEVYLTLGRKGDARRDLVAVYESERILDLLQAEAAYTLAQLAWENEDTDDAQMWIERAMEKSPRTEYGLLQAHIYMEQGQLVSAKSLYDTAINFQPFNLEARLGRAEYHRIEGNTDEALEDYTFALRADGTNLKALRGRAAIHRMQGAFERAIGDYTVAITLNPEDGNLYAGRGDAYIDLGNTDAALDDLNTALDLGTDDGAGVYNNRALIYQGRGNTEAALADYETALDLLPAAEQGNVRYNRATLYYRNGAFATARTDLEAVTDLLPDDAEVWLLLGDVYAAQGEREAALDAYETHIDISTTNGQLPVQRATTFVNNMILPTEPAAIDPTAVQLGRITTAANVRVGPELTSPVAFELEPDERVLVLEQDASGFYLVMASDRVGWVAETVIEIQAPVRGIGLLSVAVNLRDAPSVEGARLAGLPTGEQLTVLGMSADEAWFYVLAQGGKVRGWVPATGVRTSVDRSRLVIVSVDAPTGEVVEATAIATSTPEAPATVPPTATPP